MNGVFLLLPFGEVVFNSPRARKTGENVDDEKNIVRFLVIDRSVFVCGCCVILGIGDNMV